MLSISENIFVMKLALKFQSYQAHLGGKCHSQEQFVSVVPKGENVMKRRGDTTQWETYPCSNVFEMCFWHPFQTVTSQNVLLFSTKQCFSISDTLSMKRVKRRVQMICKSLHTVFYFIFYFLRQTYKYKSESPAAGTLSPLGPSHV